MIRTSVKDTAFSYRHLVPPFSLRQMFGEQYLEGVERPSINDWRRFEWVRPSPSPFGRQLLMDWAAENGVDKARLEQVWTELEAFTREAEMAYRQMDETQREQARTQLPAALGFEASDVVLQPQVVEVELAALIELGLPKLPSIPPIDVGGVLKLPTIPTIPGLDPSHPLPPLLADDFFKSAGDLAVGFAAGVWETIKQLVLGFATQTIAVLGKFVERMGKGAALLMKGELDRAFGEVLRAVAFLVTDMAQATAAVIVNFLLDASTATFLGLFFGRPLTRGERNFAHAIFGNRINVTAVRIVKHLPQGRAVVGANLICVPGSDLSNPDHRHTFAHELTHVFQDQLFGGSGTVQAAAEQLGHWWWNHGDPYKYDLPQGTTWDDLTVEAQAQLVGDYQIQVVDQSSGPFVGFPDLRFGNTKSTAERILGGQSLFGLSSPV